MAITTTGHTKQKDWLQNFIKEGKVIIDGVTHTIPIFNVERSGDIIIFYLYLDDSYAGVVSKFQLIDTDGDVFDDQPDSINKPGVHGLLAAFKYTLTRA